MFDQSIMPKCYGDDILFSVDLTHFKDLSKILPPNLMIPSQRFTSRILRFYLILYYDAGQFFLSKMTIMGPNH